MISKNFVKQLFEAFSKDLIKPVKEEKMHTMRSEE